MSKSLFNTNITEFGEAIMTSFIKREGVLSDDELQRVTDLRELLEEIESMAKARKKFDGFKNVLYSK